MPAETEKTFRPRAEIEATIKGFSPADWARLHKVGRIFASGTDWDFEDLIQEAELRTLRGTRNCPVDVDVMKHLIDTMSSIADSERKKARNQMPHVAILQGVAEDGAEDPASPDWSAEDNAVFEGEYKELLALFDDDVKGRELVEGIVAGFSTDDLKELTGLQGTAYDSKRTLVRRRFLKFVAGRREDVRS
ncbi:hypothetical protein G6321_00002045 (plasmid) [Bradyrhizobium barranii subsp. barranii]|uniref:Sigma-70 family RNA polymerase sigma factor n=1 Tax=Bradyrhizobium barranii subsp. barranii TaxID=2823807 RepID=A0A7Z0TU63_9BRAD|nr:hypothetical protein [Bradyrhizobium barranii]UGX89565.1 hypothetical protein G6321_00002045 [Bradyrhizobium barranii subsp. barranii]